MQLKPTVILNNSKTPDIFWLFFPLSIIEILLISFYLKKKIKNFIIQVSIKSKYGHKNEVYNVSMVL